MNEKPRSNAENQAAYRRRQKAIDPVGYAAMCRRHVYKFRQKDPDRHREYHKQYMRKRRAKKRREDIRLRSYLNCTDQPT